MQAFLVYENTLINIVVIFASAWVVAMTPHPRLFKLMAAVICTGGLTNLYGLVSVSYHSVWPGELLFNLGSLAMLIWLAGSGHKPKAHPPTTSA